MSTAVRIAICTNRTPAQVRPCLEAVARQAGGVGAMLVCSGVSGALAAEHRRALGEVLPGAETLHEPRPGLSLARNLALARCGEQEVIAYIDDDALVGPGWLERLRAAWDAAGSEVACIGGPIRPKFPLRGRPEWLSDRLLPVLTVLDYGPSPLDLDPAVRTLYGANVSFRAGPLRAAGGFDPAYGHSGGSTWFAEEDVAQVELARRGFVIRYVPDAWVWHVIAIERLEPRAFLRRRFRYGATLGARQARPLHVAAARSLKAGAGLAVALVQRDRTLAMERAVRAVENAGVLAGPLLRRR